MASPSCNNCNDSKNPLWCVGLASSFTWNSLFHPPPTLLSFSSFGSQTAPQPRHIYPIASSPLHSASTEIARLEWDGLKRGNHRILIKLLHFVSLAELFKTLSLIPTHISIRTKRSTTGESHLWNQVWVGNIYTRIGNGRKWRRKWNMSQLQLEGIVTSWWSSKPLNTRLTLFRPLFGCIYRVWECKNAPQPKSWMNGMPVSGRRDFGLPGDFLSQRG